MPERPDPRRWVDEWAMRLDLCRWVGFEFVPATYEELVEEVMLELERVAIAQGFAAEDAAAARREGAVAEWGEV